MFLILILISDIFFGNMVFTGLPTNASSIAEGACGVASISDPAYFNPAFLVYSNNNFIISFNGISTGNTDYYSYPLPGFSPIQGKFLNSITLMSPKFAIFWRILENREFTESDTNYIRATFRADEFGISIPIQDTALSNFSIGLNLKYIHISYSELTYPNTNQVPTDEITYISYPAHGFYTDIGIGYIFGGMSFGISARNLFGKIWKDDLIIPTVYRTGFGWQNNFISLGYDFEYQMEGYNNLNHFKFKFISDKTAFNFGLILDNIDITYTTGIQFNYSLFNISLALWGTENEIKNRDYRTYFSIGMIK